MVNLENLPIVNFPFKKPDKRIGSSKKTEVYGFDPEGLAAKIPRSGRKEFGTVDEALNDIKLHRNSIRKAADFIEKRGGRPSTMLPQEAVIYKKDNGGITYARIQHYLREAAPLSELVGEIGDKPKEDLEELKRIFLVNIDLWKKEGVFLDIVGSTTAKRPILTRIIKHLFPLFFSENIMMDKNNGPFVVDIGNMLGADEQNIKMKLRGFAQYVGSALSVRIIDRMLARKKDDE